jgi:hypothetical protein
LNIGALENWSGGVMERQEEDRRPRLNRTARAFNGAGTSQETKGKERNAGMLRTIHNSEAGTQKREGGSRRMIGKEAL